MKRFSLRITCGLFIVVCLAGVVAVALKIDPIKSQERVGSTLVVRFESGLVTTNSLFLAMSPEVKAEVEKIEKEKVMKQTLADVIADTRQHIPETANLEDSQVAFLYLSQMKKNAERLLVNTATNTLEFLIGTGIREDLKGGGE